MPWRFAKNTKEENTMITRRSFLIGATGFLTFSLLDKYINYFEQHGEPLIEAPKDFDRELTIGDDDWFELGSWDDCQIKDYPPPPTWRKYLEEYCGEDVDENDPETVEWLILNWEIQPKDYDKTYSGDHWEESYMDKYYFRQNTPNADAFEYLSGLNLGKDLEFKNRESHGLVFMDMCGVHGDTCGVEPVDLVSLSLLQQRLVELGEKTKVRLY